MARLEPGMLIKTNYSGPYRIKDISRGCTCPSYVATLNMRDKAPDRAPHIHLTVTRPNGKGRFWLNGYDEDKLRRLEKSYNQEGKLIYDMITILPAIQMSMFKEGNGAKI